MSTWVLLRGLIRDARHWGDFPAQFQLALGAQHVVTLDFPGNGSLFAEASPASVAELAQYCHARLGQLGYAPPYNVLALSMGAMVAVAWSGLYPDELEKMVLINTSLSPHNPFYHRLRPANYPALIRHLLSGSPVRRESLILKLTSRLESRTEDKRAILDRWVRYAGEFPVSRANMLRQLRAALGYRAPWAAPPTPVLLLAGEQDQLVNVECSLALARHWRCALRLHPSAGHDLPLDDGVWVTREVGAWLEDKSGDASS